jgi:hypothetical protein
LAQAEQAEQRQRELTEQTLFFQPLHLLAAAAAQEPITLMVIMVVLAAALMLATQQEQELQTKVMLAE